MAVIFACGTFIIFKTDLLSGLAIKPKVFSSGGVNITLTNMFSEREYYDCAVSYTSEYVDVNVYKQDYPYEYDLQRYILDVYNTYITDEDIGPSVELRSTDSGMQYLEYSYTSKKDDETYHSFRFFFRTSDAFWDIVFLTFEEDAGKCRDSILEWSETISFSD